MNVIRALKKLLFGETWLLPGALAVGLAATLVIRHLLASDWHRLGGFVLLAFVIAAVALSVSRSASPR